MLEGLLVDLVPYGREFDAYEHAWLNGPGVYYWAMGGRWFMTHAMLQRWQHEDEAREHPNPSRIEFGVRTKDGVPIGIFGVREWQPVHRLASLTAMIGDPAYWGGGYGTDALLLVIDYAFDWLDARKVWLMTMAENARVLRQMEKVGLRLEAQSREAAWANQAWVDAPIFGMLREEWPGRAAMIEQLGLRERSGT